MKNFGVELEPIPKKNGLFVLGNMRELANYSENHLKVTICDLKMKRTAGLIRSL